ncbi:ribbon-helix-helix domain-containing protein [Corynebacterium glucuronolyticum]|uniref:ribbon-helix-helix domain-containing protein n=1 Tax=Corynebacterium glucuronolyticum TaxID=39791 RepID=UPI00223B7415|nr:ribbon-helix-helix domain-containing protein [Corynebacterium glucuronolyticum]MCT1442926.1 ribbon-helix-helix domain-containing protein [Corynebacterium glucuronolyticum]
MEQWVAEAEEGYDVDGLKKRGRAADPTHVVAVRLTTDELESLDRLAAERDPSRSELVRQAIAALTAA